MPRVTHKTRNMLKSESGATAVEYVLLVVAIAIVIVASLFAFGTALQNKFNGAATCVSTGVTTSTVNC